MKYSTELMLFFLLVIYNLMVGFGNLDALLLFIYAALIINIVWSLILTQRGVKKTKAFWGYFFGSNLVMFLIHVIWLFDKASNQLDTQSSLIFAVMPFYALIIGGITSAVFKAFENS